MHRLQPADALPRRIFPYSVIVGGAYSGQELTRARKLDRVVERHYAGFGASTTVQRMPADTLMYVSYRKSDQVFWSKAKHRIPKGETVLCDGDNFARTRCGNRLSLKPQTPIAPKEEPAEEAMDIPDQPNAPLLSAIPTASAPDADFFVPVSPVDLSRLLSPFNVSAPPFTSAGVPGGSERPYNFGSSPGASPFVGNGLAYPATGNVASSNTGGGNSTGSGSSTGGSGEINPLPTNTVEIPEPGSLPLMALGLLLGGFLLCQVRLSRVSDSRAN